MNRFLPVILFLIVLITPFALAPKQAAKPRDALQLIVVTPNVEGIKREFADAFSDWHLKQFGTPVNIDYRSYGGSSEIVRFFRASEDSYKKLGTYQIDLVWGGGSYLFESQLKKPGFLEGLTLPKDVIDGAYPAHSLNGLPLLDAAEKPAWFGTALSSFGIVYNKDVLRYLDVHEPTSWRDLAAAPLHGWFISADPTRSSSVKAIYMIIVEHEMLAAEQRGETDDIGWARGMGLIRLMSSNARYFTDASSSVASVVSSGDSGVGMAIDFYGRAQLDAVGDARFGYVEPRGETVIDADPIAMIKGAEHRELAIQFIEFCLSERGQRLWNTRAGAPNGPRSTSLRRLPIRQSVYDSPTDFTDHVNPFSPGFAFVSSNDRKKTFGIMGDLIEMSCMNLLDELRATRAAIEHSSRREELLAKLGTFPYGQNEALKRAAAYDKASPTEKLAMKRTWEGEFRDEYEKLIRDAE